MENTISKTSMVLSYLIIVLTIIACTGGLWIPGLYRDNLFVKSTWPGTDIISLVVSVPLLIVSTYLARGGSTRFLLIWLGLLQSTLYNYGFYLFGSAFNPFFLVYTALCGLSLWTLFIGLIHLNPVEISSRFSKTTPVKWISGFMLFIGLGLSSVYISQCISFIFSGQIPSIITKTGHPTNVVFGLDFTLVIPLLIVGAIWIWQKRPWGYILATIVNVKGTVYMIGLCLATYTAYLANPGTDLGEIFIWAAIGIICLVLSIILLSHIQSKE